jgi:uncharacterized membrane protein
MGKMEYLDALKRAMPGLPPHLQAKTLAYYEQRFVDGLAAGRSEEEIGRELDDPNKIAMTLRASAHLNSFNETKNPANLLRFLVSAVGLAIFNLFMVVPAAVFGALLTALYACAFAFYFGGVVLTASALAGSSEFVFDKPGRHVTVGEDSRRSGPATVTIGPHGIQVHKDKDSAPTIVIDGDSGSVIREDSGAGRIRIATDMDESTRAAQIAVGAGMVLGGIALFLAALVVTRYTFIGIRRYLQMNLSLLKSR